MTEHLAVIAMKEWLLAIPIVALVFVPGLGVGYRFASRNRLSHAWAIGMAFVVSLAWLSVVAIIAFLTGLSLSFVTASYLVAIPFSLWLLFDEWRSVRAIRRAGGQPTALDDEGRSLRRGVSGLGLGGLATALVAGVTALWQGPWWYGTPDSYYHIAASRSLLATGRPIVTDPCFGTNSTLPDSTAGMWNTMQAVVAQVLPADISALYRGFTALGAAVVILGMWLLVREVSRSDMAATIATVAYGVAAWYTDFRAFGYPNKLSISLAFIAIALLVRVVVEPKRVWIVAAGVAGFTALSVHLASGELALLCGGGMLVVMGAVALLRRDPKSKQEAWAATRGVAAALLMMVVIALPTLGPRVAALRGSTVLGSESFIWAGEQIIDGLPLGTRMVTPGGFDFGGPWLFWMTAAIGGLMIWELVRKGGHRTAAALPLVLMAHAITVVPPISTIALDFSSYMVARMVELLRFSPYVALAWTLGTVHVGKRERVAARAMGITLLAVAILTAVPFIYFTYEQDAGEQRRGNIFAIETSQEFDMRMQWSFPSIWMLRDEVGDDYPVVAADPLTGYHLAGLVDVAIVASLPTHLPVFIDRDEVARREGDMEYFFTPAASDEEREAIAERWDIDYAFVWRARNGDEVIEQLAADVSFDPVVETDTVKLYRYSPR